MEMINLPIDLKTLDHELRTPLTSILGIAHVLRKSNLNPSQQEYVNNILDSANRLLSLANQLSSPRSACSVSAHYPENLKNSNENKKKPNHLDINKNYKSKINQAVKPPTEINDSISTFLLRKEAHRITTNHCLHVLLVEDNILIQKIHQNMLTEIGCQVDIAETAQQAISNFNKGYDVIFMDIGLPDRSGIEASAEIRRLENKEKPLKIIALTAYTGDEIANQCRAAGINEIANKPISKEELQYLIYGEQTTIVSV